METVKKELITSLENMIGYKLSYRSISPSIFSYISINNLVIYKEGESENILADIGSLKAFYSPFYFFSGSSRTPLQAVKSFTITKARFNINLDRDGDVLTTLSGNETGEISFLPLTTRISGRSIDVRFMSSGTLIEGSNLFFSLVPDKQSYRTRLNGEIYTRFFGEKVLLSYAEAEVKINGTVSESFESLNFTVSTENFQTNLADLTEQTFQFIATTNQFELRKVQDYRPIDLVLRHDSEAGDWFFSFNSENFRPDSLITLKGNLSQFGIYGSSLISGSGSILYNPGRNDALYSLNSTIDFKENVLNRPIVLKTDLTGDFNQINVRSLDMKTTEGRALFSGDITTDRFFPTGKLSLIDIQMPTGILLNSTLDITHHSGFLSLNTSYIDTGRGGFDDVNLVVFPEGDEIAASLEALLPGTDNQKGRINIDALVRLGSEPEISSFISLKDLPGRTLSGLLPRTLNASMIPDEIVDTLISSEMILETDWNDFSLSVSDFRLVSAEDSENRLSFSAAYGTSGFKINDLYFNWNEYDLNGYVNSSRDGEEYLISTHFDLEDKPYRIDVHYSSGQIVLEGDYGLYGLFQKAGDQSYQFSINSTALPLPWENNTFLADISLTGLLEKGNLDLFIDKTGISTDRFLTLNSPSIEVTARVDNQGADIYELFYRDNVSSLKGLGRVTYLPGEITSWLSLLDESGKSDEHYDLYFSSDRGEIDSRLSVISSPLERLRESGLKGNVSFDLGFNGTYENPEYQVVVNTERMNLDGTPAFISTFIRGDKDQVRISDLELEYSGIMFNRGLLMLDLNEGKLIATGAVNQNINRSKASTSLSAFVNINQSLDIFSLSRLSEIDMTGQLTAAPITWDGLNTFPRTQVNLKKEGKLISGSVKNGKVLSASYELESGAVSLDIKDQFPFRFKAQGVIKGNDVDVSVSDLVFDPSFLNYFMPVDPFRDKRSVIFTAGDISGDFRVHGPLTDPDFDGFLSINDVEVESPFLAEIPEPVSSQVYLEGHSLRINPFSIDLSKGNIFVDSSFEFDGGLPTIYNLDIEIRGSEGARVAYAIPGYSWDGHFTGPVHIEGSRDGGFLRGILTCNNLESSIKSDARLGQSTTVVRSPSVNGFIVDLTILTGKDVNFYFPNRQVPIIQATAEKGNSINIAYDSRSDELALVGRVDVRTGEINYFNKTFYLQEGFIDFDESQIKFNPRLNVRADVISKDDLGDDVTISLLFDDYLMNEFKPEFMSFPRKSENEILALLGQSFIPSNDPEQVSVASVLVATGGMIGKNTIMQPFEEAIKSSLDLDFVSFNTNLIENAILDRFQDQSIYENGSNPMNFARYLEDTSLFVGEYIGEYLFLEGSLVVDYDESRSVLSTFGGLELNLNLSLQFITPFVLIDWTYDPTTNPDSGYFLPQNTISFTWQYSY